jgi:hypothetical protein
MRTNWIGFGSSALLSALTLLAPAAPLLAAPMSPEVNKIGLTFSAAVQDSFVLLGDTDNPKLVYYIPRRGGIAVQAPKTQDPIPRFSVFARFPSFGYFQGEELTQIGGSFSTTNDLGALGQLIAEANTQGIRVTPAPVQQVGVQYLVNGQLNTDGRIDVKCEDTFITVNGKEKRVPVCRTRQSPDEPYELDTNAMYKFISTKLAPSSTVAQDLTFQATLLPDFTPQVRTIMGTGAQWDSILSSNAHWTLRTSNLTRQARVHINWSSFLEQASVFAAYHNFACVDIEVQGFFSKQAMCSAENECGTRIEFLQDDGVTWGPKAPNDADFANAIAAFDREFRNEVFNQVQVQPVLGRVSTKAGYGFTLRANYEQIIKERNEVRNFIYNPGPSTFEADTKLNIDCLLGGFEEGRVRWNMDSSGCRALLGQP